MKNLMKSSFFLNLEKNIKEKPIESYNPREKYQVTVNIEKKLDISKKVGNKKY